MGHVWVWIKTKCFPIHIMFGYVFVVSGLIVCFLMLLTYLFIWPLNKTLYRKIVVNLAYTHWCQFTFMCHWWSGSDCTLRLEKESDLAMIGKEHVITLMNHKYDIDWLMAWILAERLQMLGGTKIYGKSSLKYVPLIGWAWMFTESIFLRRDWNKDKQIISRDLKYMCDYPSGYWVTLLLFCEGTRFTETKHAASMEVAKKKGLPLLKHHLLPRTKGFVHSVHGLKGKGCCHTIASVVLVDLQGVEQIARCFALYCVFTSFSLLTGSPFMGLMYDVTGSYTVGFVTLICVSLVALSLMLAICVIDHLTKKVTESNSMAIVVQSQATDTKC